MNPARDVCSPYEYVYSYIVLSESPSRVMTIWYRRNATLGPTSTVLVLYRQGTESMRDPKGNGRRRRGDYQGTLHGHQASLATLNRREPGRMTTWAVISDCQRPNGCTTLAGHHLTVVDRSRDLTWSRRERGHVSMSRVHRHVWTSDRVVLFVDERGEWTIHDAPPPWWR